MMQRALVPGLARVLLLVSCVCGMSLLMSRLLTPWPWPSARDRPSASSGEATPSQQLQVRATSVPSACHGKLQSPGILSPKKIAVHLHMPGPLQTTPPPPPLRTQPGRFAVHQHDHEGAASASWVGPTGSQTPSMPCSFDNTTISILLDLFSALGGMHWDACPVPWRNASRVAEWCFITVQSACTLQIRIRGVAGVAGTLPPSLGGLAQLEWLQLYGLAQLTGTIPASLGSLTRLQALIVTACRISGTIPASLGNLAQLRVLFLNQMQLSGTIPPELGQLSLLEDFSLGANPQLAGTLPPSLGSLSRLWSLSLTVSTQISGTVPDSFANLSRLANINLSGPSKLSGTIPPFFGNFTYATSLLFSDTEMSGTIPPSLGNLQRLYTLNLRGIRGLSGTIPPTLIGLTRLSLLLLSKNTGLSGTIPSMLCDLPLTQLYLDRTSLSGTIPPCLANMPSLYFLEIYSLPRLSGTIPSFGTVRLTRLLLYDNPLLSGVLPESLSNVTSLWSLMVHSNPLLSGTIPSLAGMGRLRTLHLYSNPTLSGMIPLSLERLTQLQELYLHSLPALSGTVPASFSSLTRLARLDMSSNPLLSGSMPPITAHTLVNMDVSNCNNLSGAWPFPSPLRSAFQLSWAHTQLSGTIPPSLCGWINIVNVDFSFNRLSGSLPPCLANTTSVQLLALSGNRLSGRFATVLPQSLRTALLDGNAFTYADDDCLPANSGLQSLDLSNCNVSATFAQVLRCFTLEGLRYLRLSNSGLTGVFDYEFNGCSNLSTEAILSIAKPSTLTSLDLSDNNMLSGSILNLPCCSCTPVAVPMLNLFPQLTSLSLSGTNIFIEAVPSSLNTLLVVDTPRITAAALQQALTSRLLQQLDIRKLHAQSQEVQSLIPLIQAGSETLAFPVTWVSCPRWQTKASAAIITADLGAFGYLHCRCTRPTWYWYNHTDAQPQCRPCPSSDLLCDPAILNPVHTVIADRYPLFSPRCSEVSMRCLPEARLTRCLASDVCATRPPAAAHPDQPALVTGYYCAPGHDPTSRLCSMCLPGSFLYGTSCGACSGWEKATLPVVLLLCLAAYVHFLRRQSGSSPSSFTPLLIVLRWLQLVYLTTTETSGSSSAAHGHMFGWVQSLAMFHPWGVDCLAPTLKRHHLELILTLPLVLSAIVCVCLTALHFHRPSPIRLRATLLTACERTWDLLYLPVCAAVFQALSCNHSPEANVSFLARAPYRSCSEPALTALSVVTLLYFTVAYPILYAYRRFKRHQQAGTPDAFVARGYQLRLLDHADHADHSDYADVPGQALDQDTSSTTHPYIPQPQTSSLWWWEPCIIRLRNVIVTVIVFSLPVQHPLIPLLIYIVLLLNLLLQLQLAPYSALSNNRLSTVTLTSLLVIYLCTMVDDNAYSATSREVVIVLAFSLTMVYALATLLPGAVRWAAAKILPPQETDAE